MKNEREIELRKENVLTYLNTAREQLGQAQSMLAPKTELWNQIHQMDSDLEDMMDELTAGGYDEDSLSARLPVRHPSLKAADKIFLEKK